MKGKLDSKPKLATADQDYKGRSCLPYSRSHANEAFQHPSSTALVWSGVLSVPLTNNSPESQPRTQRADGALGELARTVGEHVVEKWACNLQVTEKYFQGVLTLTLFSMQTWSSLSFQTLV